MADKAPAHPSQPDHQNNVLVYSVASEYHGNATALQAPVNVSKPTTVYYRTTKFEPSAGASADSVRPVLVESVCSSSSGSADNGLNPSIDSNENSDYKPEAISPPFGWKRILSNGIIIYVSPSNAALSCLDQVKGYVQSEGTCKCGLECPLHIPLVFNFDPKVLTKPYSPTVIAPGDLTKLCNHKRKLLANIETLSADSRFGGLDALRRKKRRMVVGGGGGQVIIGNNQVVGPGGTVLQPNTPVDQQSAVMQPNTPVGQQGAVLQPNSAAGQQNVVLQSSTPVGQQGTVVQPNTPAGQQGPVSMYQGMNNSSLGMPPGTPLQQSSAVLQSSPLPQTSHLQATVNIPQGMNLSQGSTLPPQNSSPSSIGVHPGSSMLGMHQGLGGPTLGIHQGNHSTLNMQPGVNMQSNPNAISMQQNMIFGLQQGSPSQTSLQQNSAMSTQHNIASLQPNTVLQQVTPVNPSPAASPALSGGSLPPPSPLPTRMTPPSAPSSSRSDLQNPQFVKMQQQIPSEVWREGNYPNGFLDYMNSAGGPGGVLPQSPSTSQDPALIQHQIQGSPSPDLTSSISGSVNNQGDEVQPRLSILAPNQMLAQSIVQSNSPLPQPPNLSIMPPSSQVLTQVLHNHGQEVSVSLAHNIPIQHTQGTMVRRFPVHMTSQSPSQSPQSAYQLNQPVQIQYENTRVFPPGYSIKYTKKTNNQLQQQVIEDHQVSMSHAQPQTITSYQNNIQSSQHFSHQQVVSNHHLIVSSQQNSSSQQQIVNTHQNIDQTNIALQQNVNQQNIQSVIGSKQGSNSQLQNVNSQDIGSSCIGRVRTPPWHQNKQVQQHQPQPQHVEKTSWSRKSKQKDESSPSFLEDPSGYLAQQTAMLRQVVAGREEEEGPKTMASGHTASSNTLTSVLAGRTNTLTVSVGSQEPKPQQHILVSGNGQFIIAAAPKVNPPSPLLLPAPLLLQHIDTVQLPQLVVPPTLHEDVIEKRKSPNKKRKLSPTTSGTTTMLLSPQPQQQVLTILPSKTPIANMIQPLNVVQNFPIQQFLVPSMVMSDGTILQDTVQVNLLPGGGVFSSGQNLITPTSVVLRAPTSSQPQQPQQPKFLHSPNQFVNFSGDLSSQVVPTTTNTTVVQQNTTTIVQQTTMLQQPSPSYILDKPNFILTSDKNNFILNPNGNNSDKITRPGYVRNSVSTQTQNQVVQVSSTGPGGLVVTTGGSRGGSPPDTTTLSPADQEVSTSVTSPDPSMVHCVSSSNLHDDSSPYQIDTTTSTIPYHTGNGGKTLSYDESSYMHQPLQDKDITQLSSDDCSGKMLCTTTSDGSPLDTLEESDGLVN